MRYTRAQIVDGTGFAPDQLFETVQDYNGWFNRETWAVALYINNDQGWQEQVFELVRDYLTDRLEKESGEPTVYESIATFRAYQAGQIIRENVETLLDPSQYRHEFGDQQPEALAAALYDIGSLYRVNWDELGAAFLSDVQEASA